MMSWWSEEERFPAAADLRRLAGLLSDSPESSFTQLPAEIIGFGSVKLDGKRVLLAVVHEALYRARAEVARFGGAAGAVRAAVDDLFRRTRASSVSPTAELTTFEFDAVSEFGRAMLSSLDLPQGTRFM